MNNKNTGRETTPKAAVILPPNEFHGIAAIFSFRLPKSGQTDPFFGGARSYWNSLTLPSAANGFDPPVRSFVDRKPGTRRGVRFILWESALDYFKRLASEQNPRQQNATLSTKEDESE